jgi:hypothetical protein
MPWMPVRRVAAGCYARLVRARILALLAVGLLWTPALASAQNAPTRAQVRQMLSGIEDTPSAQDWQRVGEGALPILIELYQDVDEPAYVRLRAVGATAAFPRRAVRTFLLGVARLEGQGDLYVREAVFALARGFGRDAVQDVASFLDHDDATVREGAAMALGRIGGRAAERALRARLPVERDRVVREAIQRAL